MRFAIIMFFIAIIVVAALWWFFIRDFEGEKIVVKNEETGVVEVFNLDPHFIAFKPIVIPVIHDGVLLSNIGVIVELEVNSKGRVIIVSDAKTKLRNAFMRDLKLATKHYHKTRGYNLEEIKQRFLKSCSRLLGEKVVDRVLIKSDYHHQFN